jgi:hypothetical protein
MPFKCTLITAGEAALNIYGSGFSLREEGEEDEEAAAVKTDP